MAATRAFFVNEVECIQCQYPVLVPYLVRSHYGTVPVLGLYVSNFCTSLVVFVVSWVAFSDAQHPLRCWCDMNLYTLQKKGGKFQKNFCWKQQQVTISRPRTVARFDKEMICFEHSLNFLKLKHSDKASFQCHSFSKCFEKDGSAHRKKRRKSRSRNLAN